MPLKNWFRSFEMLREADRAALWRLRHLILLSLLLLWSGVLVGLLFSVSLTEVSSVILGQLASLSEKISNLTTLEQLLVIFLNNGIKIFLVIFLGLLFGLIPLIFLLFNGFIVGLVAINVGWPTFWLGLLPHGIFEISALLLGAALGWKLGLTLGEKVFNRPAGSLRAEINNSLSLFWRLITPLLFFAAFVEIYLTRPLLNLLS